MGRKDTRRAVALIYATAGVPFGVVGEALPLLLYTLGVSPRAIGLASLVQLASVCKLLWAPLVDRTGVLTGWLRGAMAALSLSFVAMAAAAQQGDPLYIVMAATVLSLSAATLDLSADATLVRLLRSGRLAEAPASSLRIGAFKTGLTLGGGLCIACASAFGWSLPLTACALVALIGMRRAPALAVHLPELAPMPLAAWRRGLQAWLVMPRTRWLLGYIFAYKLSLTIAAPMSKVFWSELGVKMSSVGLVLASCGLVGATCGAALAGVGVLRFGLTRTLLCGSLLEMGVCGLQAAFAASIPAEAAWGCFLVAGAAESLAQGLTTTALVALIARNTSGNYAATQSGVLSASFALTRAVGGALGGALYAALAPAPFFAVAALCSLPAWALLLRAEPETVMPAEVRPPLPAEA